MYYTAAFAPPAAVQRQAQIAMRPGPFDGSDLRDQHRRYISGVVTIGGGTPAPNSKVMLFRESNTTPLAIQHVDSEGRYRFDGVEPGNHAVVTVHEGGQIQGEVIHTSASPQQITDPGDNTLDNWQFVPAAGPDVEVVGVANTLSLAGTGTYNTLAVNLPEHTESDMLLALISVNNDTGGGTAITPPAGWFTAYDGGDGGGGSARILFTWTTGAQRGSTLGLSLSTYAQHRMAARVYAIRNWSGAPRLKITTNPGSATADIPAQAVGLSVNGKHLFITGMVGRSTNGGVLGVPSGELESFAALVANQGDNSRSASVQSGHLIRYGSSYAQRTYPWNSQIALQFNIDIPGGSLPAYTGEGYRYWRIVVADTTKSNSTNFIDMAELWFMLNGQDLHEVHALSGLAPDVSSEINGVKTNLSAAYDRNAATSFSTNGDTIQWFSISIPDGIYSPVDNIRIQAPNAYPAYERMPTNFVVEAGNWEGVWTPIKVFTTPAWAPGEVRNFPLLG